MAEETLLTAARRVVRFVRGDDERHGGLLQQDTIQANETLAVQVSLAERAEKQGPVRFAVLNSVCFTYRTEADMHRNVKMLGGLPGDSVKLYNPNTGKTHNLTYAEALEPADLFFDDQP
jgi:hypothetical protein